jgi:hypothetical protein
VTLDEALKKVKDEQEQLASAEYKLSELQQKAPDLADQVAKEKLSLADGIKDETQEDKPVQR